MTDDARSDQPQPGITFADPRDHDRDLSEAQREMLRDSAWDLFGEDWALNNPHPRNTRNALRRKGFVQDVWRPIKSPYGSTVLICFLTKKGRDWLVSDLLSRVDVLESARHEPSYIV